MARSGEEIREDLRIAASTATGFCHDAAMRLAGDFESLLARIAAVDDEATCDDVYSEISLALGTDDSADEDVDFKRDLTANILRHFRAALAASPTPTTEEQR